MHCIVPDMNAVFSSTPGLLEIGACVDCDSGEKAFMSVAYHVFLHLFVSYSRSQSVFFIHLVS